MIKINIRSIIDIERMFAKERGPVMDKTNQNTKDEMCVTYRRKIVELLENINTVDYLVKIYSFAKVFLKK